MKAIHEHRSYCKDLPVSISVAGKMNFLAHWHTDIELIYMLEGTQNVGINQEVRTLKKGDLAICSSGDIHFYSGSDAAAKQIIVIFKPEFIGYPAGWPQGLRFSDPFILRSSTQVNESACNALDKIEHILLEIIDEHKNKSEYYIDAIKSKLLEICVLSPRHFTTSIVGSIGHNHRQYNLERMQKALQHIEGNFTHSLNLDELAACTNLSYYHFSRLFKSTVGMNFKNYLNKRRIEHAESLMSDSNLSITQIAFECGFDCTRTFYRAFKSFKGATPKMCRGTVL